MPNMIRRKEPRKLSDQRGSMMIEVLVSVVLLSVSILGLVRVLGQSVKDSGDLEYRSVASTMADELVGRMWVDRANIATYATTDPEALAELPNGTRMVTVAGNVVTVTIGWQAPGAASASQYQVAATLAVNTP
jgi:type IV pilus assembly protein PilV